MALIKYFFFIKFVILYSHLNVHTITTEASNISDSDIENLKSELIKEKELNSVSSQKAASLTESLKNLQLEIEALNSEKEKSLLQFKEQELELRDQIIQTKEENQKYKDLQHETKFKIEELFGYLQTLQFEGIMEYGSLEELETAEINYFDYFMQKISKLKYDLKSKDESIATLEHILKEFKEKEKSETNPPKFEIVTIQALWGSWTLIQIFYVQIIKQIISFIPYELKQLHLTLGKAFTLRVNLSKLYSSFAVTQAKIQVFSAITQSFYFTYFHSNLYKFYQYVIEQWYINSSNFLKIVDKINYDIDANAMKYLGDNERNISSFPQDISNKLILLLLLIYITYIIAKITKKIIKGFYIIIFYITKFFFPCFFPKKKGFGNYAELPNIPVNITQPTLSSHSTKKTKNSTFENKNSSAQNNSKSHDQQSQKYKLQNTNSTIHPNQNILNLSKDFLPFDTSFIPNSNNNYRNFHKKRFSKHD